MGQNEGEEFDSDERSHSSVSKAANNTNSKEEYKSLTKKITEILNRIRCSSQKLQEI